MNKGRQGSKIYWKIRHRLIELNSQGEGTLDNIPQEKTHSDAPIARVKNTDSGSTLVPMLVAGLALIIIGMAILMKFV